MAKNINAFIFARGGSKGIPNKNLKKVGNKSLVEHSIDSAKEIEEINKIFVSTDSNEIAKVAEKNSAIVIERPAELATDNAPEFHAWQHAIKEVNEKFGEFDYFLSLPATAPLRDKIDIKKCISSLKSDVDLVLTMTKANRSPWFNMAKYESNGNLRLILKDKNIIRRQDAPDCFDLTTVAYFARASFITQNKGIWDGKVVGVEIPPERAIDIDTLFDLELANYIYKKSTNF